MRLLGNDSGSGSGQGSSSRHGLIPTFLRNLQSFRLTSKSQYCSRSGIGPSMGMTHDRGCQLGIPMAAGASNSVVRGPPPGAAAVWMSSGCPSREWKTSTTTFRRRHGLRRQTAASPPTRPKGRSASVIALLGFALRCAWASKSEQDSRLVLSLHADSPSGIRPRTRLALAPSLAGTRRLARIRPSWLLG